MYGPTRTFYANLPPFSLKVTLRDDTEFECRLVEKTIGPPGGQKKTVRARPGRSSGLSVLHSKSILYGDFV
jgi:hypothetical protein